MVQLLGTVFAAQHDQGPGRPLDWGGYALLVGSALSLAPRRRYRVPALVLTVAVTLTYFALAYPKGPYFLAALAALAGAVKAGHRRAGWTVAALGYAFAMVAGHVVDSIGGYPVPTPGVGAAVVISAWILLTGAVAEAVRNRSNALRELARTRTEQARARSEQQRRQTSEERLRIARELHDVVGHHLSLINVQAGVGLHLMDERPEQARVALRAIKSASAEALAEVRAVLGLLRAEDGGAPRAPVPSLVNLPALLESAGAGLVSAGAPGALPPEVDRAAYRIVQEALTNVRRHAGPGASATVTIDYGSDVLTVAVTDDGTGAPAGAPDEGNGLAGMRARAQALGGTLTAGGAPQGGFTVTATLPVPPGATDPGDPAADQPSDGENGGRT